MIYSYFTEGFIDTHQHPTPDFYNEVKKAWNFFETNNIWNTKTTQLTGRMTPYHSHFHYDMSNIFTLLKNEIVTYVAQQKSYNYATPFLKCGESWMAEYNKGDEALLHRHWPFHIVTSYYFDIEDDTPLSVGKFNIKTHEWDYFDIPIKENELIIFEGGLDHKVAPCNGKRKVLATNWYYDLGELLGIEKLAYDKSK